MQAKRQGECGNQKSDALQYHPHSRRESTALHGYSPRMTRTLLKNEYHALVADHPWGANRLRQEGPTKRRQHRERLGSHAIALLGRSSHVPQRRAGMQTATPLPQRATAVP